MATWPDLEKYVTSNYKVSQQDEGFLGLLFNTGIGRSQMVFLTRHLLMDDNEEWLVIESPVGPVDDVNLKDLLREAGQLVCGGLGQRGDVVTFKHSMPLINLDINEFERPLHLIVTSADRLEKTFAGGDRF